MSCVSRLNQLYELQLNHHDIIFMYGLCGNIRSDYYLKVRDVRVRLISCLPNSLKLSKSVCPGEQQLASWRAHLPNFAVWCWSIPYIFNYFDFGVLFVLILVEIGVNLFSSYFDVDGKRFKPNIRVVHVRDLNFVLRSKIFVNSYGQLRASHLILSL